MTDKKITKPAAAISLTAARLAIAGAVLALLLLASLHILSPEFDPSWRMISEYANGQYGWVLSLMFASWAVSSWALAFAIWSQVRTRAGKIGLVLLITAGFGEAMASVFDINHTPYHDIAGYISILCLPVAAMMISVSLVRTQPWSAARKVLMRTANLTWMSVVLLVATFAVMIGTFIQSGAKIDPQAKITALPPGVIGLVGWANRLLVLLYCVWVVTAAWQAIRVRHLSENEKSDAIA
jgi:hypothetical membrane protein